MSRKKKDEEKSQGKRRSGLSLKWCFAVYLPVFAILAVFGSAVIGFRSNDLQDWYRSLYGEKDIIYWLISYGQMVLIPAWIVICLFAAGLLFYCRELEKPFALLMEASEKISENQLDFTVEYDRKNELGRVCQAFEKMRRALYESNRKTWALLEERKRLNAAFAHDIRTPLTVLKGYVELLEKYAPGEKPSECSLSPEKQLQIYAMMKRNILRLQDYTSEMNRVQKLEDIEPEKREVSYGELVQSLRETGELLCGGRRFAFREETDGSRLFLDMQCVMQVYENLISNGARYAHGSVCVFCRVKDRRLSLCVEDDGRGFSGEVRTRGTDPFFRGEEPCEGETENHFGMGLYICRILCEKCGGGLSLADRSADSGIGASVTALFDGNQEK